MLRRLISALSAPFQRAARLPSWLLSMRGVSTSALAGVTVNAESAHRFAAFYASVRVIAETRGSLPLQLFEVAKSGKNSIVRSHPVSQLLSHEPNPDMTPMVWGETTTAHVLAWGNSYNEVTYDDRTGEASAIIPRHPSLVDPYRGEDGSLWYEVRSDVPGGRTRYLDRSQMFHVPGLGGNGILGWSVIRMAAESLGLGMAQEQMAAAFFGNRAKPGVAVSAPGTLTDQQYARLKKSLEEDYTNEKAFRSLLLEGGMTVTSFSMPMNDAQFLESRKFQGEEIACRWFRLPPHVVGYMDRATFSNIESQDLYFEKHTMRPWLIRFEQEMNRKLFSRSEWSRFYVKHNVDALLRADIKTRYDAYKTAILSGFKSRNEIRRLEDLDPVDGGDTLLLPEAIFGKSAGQPTKSSPKHRTRRRMPDTRLQGLTEQLLTGIVNRERVAVMRAAGKSDFRGEVNRFYEQHLPWMVERLQPLACDPAAAISAAESRRDAVLAADASAVSGLTESWNSAGMAAQLLGA